MSAYVRVLKQPFRLPSGAVEVVYSVVAQCDHGTAWAPMSAPMFEDARFLASFTRLEQNLHRATGCACAAPVTPDVGIIECVEVSA